MKYFSTEIKKLLGNHRKTNLQNIIIILFIVYNLFLLNGCGTNSAENNTQKLIPSVEAVQSRYGSLPLTERLNGIVKAKNQVEIYPEISASITGVYVNNGDIVNKGQLLVQLRSREFQERLKQTKANYQITVAQAKQAEARFKDIQRELERMETLNIEGLASNADLESVQTRFISEEASYELAYARVEQARAFVQESEAALSETDIRAPVAGTIGDRNAETGMLVNTNTKLFTLGKLEDLKIEVILTDRMLNYIKTGQRTEINTSYLSDEIIEAPLARISPFLHPVTHSTDAEIYLLNKDRNLKPGMFVTVDVFYGESEHATLIPLSALYENPASGATGVYVSRDTLLHEPAYGATDGSGKSMILTSPVTFEFIPTEVIAKGKMQAGVRGVEPGDWVVILGQNLLGSETGIARVHPVNWNWVEQLQNLQSQDLLNEIMMKHKQVNSDSLFNNRH
jgi:RND family efflux transporter MFP subunit